MELDKYIKFKINDFSCEFKTLNELDVSQDYVEYLHEQNEYIQNIPADNSILNQKKYIKGILSSEGNTICGLYIDRKLVGSSGIQTSTTFLNELYTSGQNIASIGIFLFNKNYQGIGLGKVLVWTSTYLLHECTQTEWFGAGMLKKNVASLKSFLACGFKKIDENEEAIKVLLNYSELIKPKFINSEVIRTVEKLTRSTLADRLS